MSQPEPPDPIRPQFQFLDYREAPNDDEVKRLPMRGQHIAAGFGCWVASIGGAYVVAMVSRSGWGAMVGWLIVLVPCCVYFAGRLGWRGFVPGVLIGAALTCLVPVGIVAVMCGTGAWQFKP
jgi:hypothetical protein